MGSASSEPVSLLWPLSHENPRGLSRHFRVRLPLAATAASISAMRANTTSVQRKPALRKRVPSASGRAGLYLMDGASPGADVGQSKVPGYLFYDSGRGRPVPHLPRPRG